jgi:hypothetical protein
VPTTGTLGGVVVLGALGAGLATGGRWEKATPLSGFWAATAFQCARVGAKRATTTTTTAVE